MTTAIKEPREPVTYSRDDIKYIMDDYGIESDDLTFISALSSECYIVENPHDKTKRVGGFPPVSIPVILVYDEYETGTYSEVGQHPFIVLNPEQQPVDYDLISLLHVSKDAEMYLWLEAPYGKLDEDLEEIDSWFRRDIYKDGITPFEGVPTWADLPQDTIFPDLD